TQAMFATAGELCTFPIPEETVRLVFREASKPGRELIAVNFAGLAGNSIVEMSGPSISEMLDPQALDNTKVTARLIIFTAVGSRALRNSPTDPCAPQLRSQLHGAFREYLTRRHGNAVLSSLASCYLRAFEGPSPDRPVKLISKGERDIEDALSIVSS